MRHLCEICSSLQIPKSGRLSSLEEQDDGQSSSQVEESQKLRPGEHILCAPFQESIQALETSANGTNGKACHFCLLVLRSLEGRSLPNHPGATLKEGPVNLVFRSREDEVELLGQIECQWAWKVRPEAQLEKDGELFNQHGRPISICINHDNFIGQEVNHDAASDEVFALIKQWCVDCTSNHKKCKEETKTVSNWLPTRVLDVGPPEGTHDPLIFSSAGSAGTYVALTHRWSLEMSVTTNANLDRRKKGIPMSELPQTFQDAIVATRKLGLRYLWIDALCIIQDSKEDWERESQNMMSIYELAWLNLSAAASEFNGRCFFKRTPRLTRPCKLPKAIVGVNTSEIREKGSETAEVFAYLPSELYAREVYNGFLERRGWVLQERILPPRTVYFGKEEVYWECSTHAASETFPWGFEPAGPRAWPLVKLKSDNGPQNWGVSIQSNRLDPRGIYEYWYNLVESYSKRDLTNKSDKLPAVLGIAQAIHKRFMHGGTFLEEYVEGLWRTDLIWGLFWGVILPESISSDGLPDEADLSQLLGQTFPSSALKETAPSYSWASQAGQVTFSPFGERRWPIYSVFKTAQNNEFEQFLINSKSPFNTDRTTEGLRYTCLYLRGMVQYRDLRDIRPSSRYRLDEKLFIDSELRSWFRDTGMRVLLFHFHIADTLKRVEAGFTAYSPCLLLIPSQETLRQIYPNYPRLKDFDPDQWWKSRPEDATFQRIGISNAKQNGQLSTIRLV